MRLRCIKEKGRKLRIIRKILKACGKLDIYRTDKRQMLVNMRPGDSKVLGNKGVNLKIFGLKHEDTIEINGIIYSFDIGNRLMYDVPHNFRTPLSLEEYLLKDLESQKCSVCKGEGYIKKKRLVGDDENPDIEYYNVICEKCRGKGYK